jgi:hypothetical protein
VDVPVQLAVLVQIAVLVHVLIPVVVEGLVLVHRLLGWLIIVAVRCSSAAVGLENERVGVETTVTSRATNSRVSTSRVTTSTMIVATTTATLLPCGHIVVLRVIVLRVVLTHPIAEVWNTPWRFDNRVVQNLVFERGDDGRNIGGVVDRVGVGVFLGVFLRVGGRWRRGGGGEERCGCGPAID